MRPWRCKRPTGNARSREALKPDYTSPYASAMAWAQMYMTAKWEDTELALHASKLEHKALEAIRRL